MNLHFEQLPPSPQMPRQFKPFDRWVTLEGEETSLFYRQSDDYVVRFPDLADFTISLDRRTVTCAPAPNVTDEAIAHLYFNQIVPLVMGCDGDLVLHGSAVVVDGRAIAFLGSSRRGKSTLAAAFARAGNPFLTDDGLILDADDAGYLVRPRAPILHLCPDSEAAILQTAEILPRDKEKKGKISARLEIPFHDQPVPLAAIFLLAQPQGVERTEMVRLSPSVAVSELLSHSFILDVEHRRRVEDLFDRLANVAERIACYTLDYPRRFAELPSVLSSIIRHVQNGDQSP